MKLLFKNSNRKYHSNANGTVEVTEVWVEALLFDEILDDVTKARSSRSVTRRITLKININNENSS